MNTNNSLYISSSAYDEFIYRIISVPRLFELFDSKQNVLVKPGKWEDPFENFILRSEQIYGQCWTFQSTSDAMWRIYSPKSDAVRIRSTIRRLFDSLSQSQCLGQGEVFIGGVQYLPNKNLMDFAKNIIHRSTIKSANIFAQSLLVKRPAFRHEREVRLLFIPYDKNQEASEIFRYFVDPNKLIDQIMIDPRVSKKNADKLKQEIKVKTNYSGVIKRSLLYAPPPDFSIEMQNSI
jgi:hypothetical protein